MIGAKDIHNLVESFWFRFVVMSVIVLAGGLVGVETYPSLRDEYGPLIARIDAFIGIFFVVEILIRLLAFGRSPWRFFFDPWNSFDFAIVALCLMPLHVEYFAVLRLVRVFRVLRLVSVLPGLQVLVGALLRSVPSIGYISVLLFLHFYIYACLGSFMFDQSDPIRFGSLDRSMLSLFQVVTLEGWVDIMNVQRYADEALTVPSEHYWSAPFFFISFILLGTMIILNLFIGVILNGMNEIKRESELREIAAKRLADNIRPSDDAQALLHEFDELRSKLDLLYFRLKNESISAGADNSNS